MLTKTFTSSLLTIKFELIPINTKIIDIIISLKEAINNEYNENKIDILFLILNIK